MPRLTPAWMTCRSALRIVGRIRGTDLSGPGSELAERFRLESDLSVRSMSRGTRQKLGLVLALAHCPRLLILDEPTSGLDPIIQQELARCLRERAAKGHTVFFSSHTLSEGEQLCNRIAILRDGKVVSDDTINALGHRAAAGRYLHRCARFGKPVSPLLREIRIPVMFGLLAKTLREIWLQTVLFGIPVTSHRLLFQRVRF